MSNTTEKKEKQNFGQFIKFALFSASAGIIQVLTFTLLSEVVIKLPAIQSAMESNATFARIMQNEYGPMYLTALILSVVWNFTFNRKFTFKSAANVPVAMLKVFAFTWCSPHFHSAGQLLYRQVCGCERHQLHCAGADYGHQYDHGIPL